MRRYSYVYGTVVRPLEESSQSVKVTPTIPNIATFTLSATEKLIYLSGLLCCFCCAVMILYGRSNLMIMNLEINSLEKQLYETKQENIRLNIARGKAVSKERLQVFIEKNKLEKIRAFRNLPTVSLTDSRQVNFSDLFNNSRVIFSCEEAITELEKRLI